MSTDLVQEDSPLIFVVDDEKSMRNFPGSTVPVLMIAMDAPDAVEPAFIVGAIDDVNSGGILQNLMPIRFYIYENTRYWN